jgi:hypothetical protein
MGSEIERFKCQSCARFLGFGTDSFGWKKRKREVETKKDGHPFLLCFSMISLPNPIFLPNNEKKDFIFRPRRCFPMHAFR